MKPVLFNNLVLRDGHQSLAATRMRTAQMLPILEKLDGMGFSHLETWGGATIDSCVRYLGENPFERLRTLKKGAPKTPHMMLLRGQNLVQYTNYPDDVVEMFVKCAAESGVDTFRIFDALNDMRNLVTPVKAVLKAGKQVQGVICYTTSPVHTLDSLAKLGVELEAMGCHSICIKDMAGLITPPAAYELVKKLKSTTKLPVTLHSHNTAGLATASYYAAIEAGVDCVDVSIAPFANGTGQPDALLMQNLLKNHPRCPSYNEATLGELQDFFQNEYEALKEFTSHANERIDGEILRYQVPGGMMSNFRTQLKEQKMDDRLNDVMKEVMFVREAMGWIPLVTPTSQIVGTQAMLNVKFGRWKMLAQPTIDVALGRYGKTPAAVDKELLEKVMAQTGQKPIAGRPADSMEPRCEALRAELKQKGLPTDNDHVVLYAMFPQQVEALYAKKEAAPAASAATPAAAPAAAASMPAFTGSVLSRKQMALTVNSKRYDVLVEEVE
jgi:oxaloacetate decarboxylase alpha subunit/pyruvate carboxylase subunit B